MPVNHTLNTLGTSQQLVLRAQSVLEKSVKGRHPGRRPWHVLREGGARVALECLVFIGRSFRQRAPCRQRPVPPCLVIGRSYRRRGWDGGVEGAETKECKGGGGVMRCGGAAHEVQFDLCLMEPLSSSTRSQGWRPRRRETETRKWRMYWRTIDHRPRECRTR